MAQRHPRNNLNDLTGTEWIKFTRSWFVCDSPRYWKNKNTELHPARFPEEMVREFLLFFTKPEQWVFDPFLGSGATLVACSEEGRNGVGIEFSPRYARIARSRLGPSDNGLSHSVIRGDSRRLEDMSFWSRSHRLPKLEQAGLQFQDGLPQFDFIITSPPYWNMLHTSRGGVKSKHKQRAEQKLDTHYSDSSTDLGNISDYDQFVEAVGSIFDQVYSCLKSGKYLVVVAQNLRDSTGEVKPLAWDLVRRISQRFLFQGERIWCQNTKMLGIWGYPKIFVPNYHHHYCLIFRKIGSKQ